jgi:hypothetical protein
MDHMTIQATILRIIDLLQDALAVPLDKSGGQLPREIVELLRALTLGLAHLTEVVGKIAMKENLLDAEAGLRF